jgi:hypothetical protein
MAEDAHLRWMRDTYCQIWVTYNYRSHDLNRPRYSETIHDISPKFDDFLKNTLDVISNVDPCFNYIRDPNESGDFIQIFKFDRFSLEGKEKDVYDIKFFLSKEEVSELVSRIKNNEEYYDWLKGTVHDTKYTREYYDKFFKKLYKLIYKCARENCFNFMTVDELTNSGWYTTKIGKGCIEIAVYLCPECLKAANTPKNRMRN